MPANRVVQRRAGRGPDVDHGDDGLDVPEQFRVSRHEPSLNGVARDAGPRLLYLSWGPLWYVA